jgi:hypothetical protein
VNGNCELDLLSSHCYLLCYQHRRMEPGIHIISNVYIVKHGYKWDLVKVIAKRTAQSSDTMSATSKIR